MWKNIIAKIWQVLAKMNVIKGLESVNKIKDIAVGEEHYNLVGKWKRIYSGYFPEWHDIKCHTVEGQKTRRMSSLQMAKQVAQEMATLVFNERCQINIDNEQLSENIHNVLKANDFYKQFQRYLEYGFALGGFVVKVFADEQGVKLSYVTAESFYEKLLLRHLCRKGYQATEGGRTVIPSFSSNLMAC